MKEKTFQEMESKHPGILRNRPNRLAKGITASLYTKKQRYKGKGAFDLSNVPILSLYGTLDSLRNWKAVFTTKKPQTCHCCGNVSRVYGGLSKAGQRRLERLRKQFNK